MVILGIRLKVSFWLFLTILWSLFKIFIKIIDILSSVLNLGNADQMLLSVINTKEEREDIEIKAGNRDQKVLRIVTNRQAIHEIYQDTISIF